MFDHILFPPIANTAVKAGVRFAREIGAKVTAYQAVGALLTHIDDEPETLHARDSTARVDR